MSLDEVINLLDDEREVEESYVLVREIKAYLDVGHTDYHPCLGIKVWKSGLSDKFPYHFYVSHHVHTPSQAGPYHPSRTAFESEAMAVREAISSTTRFIKHALQEGHEPNDAWLVPNDVF